MKSVSDISNACSIMDYTNWTDNTEQISSPSNTVKQVILKEAVGGLSNKSQHIVTLVLSGSDDLREFSKSQFITRGQIMDYLKSIGWTSYAIKKSFTEIADMLRKL